MQYKRTKTPIALDFAWEFTGLVRLTGIYQGLTGDTGHFVTRVTFDCLVEAIAAGLWVKMAHDCVKLLGSLYRRSARLWFKD